MNDYVEKFVSYVVKQDSRNVFEKVSRIVENPVIAPLYSNYEPTDVEVRLSDNTSIKFYPFEKVAELFDEYGFNDKSVCIFASWEGDPIYVQDSKIKIAPHGTGTYKADKEFGDIEIFFRWLLALM